MFLTVIKLNIVFIILPVVPNIPPIGTMPPATIPGSTNTTTTALVPPIQSTFPPLSGKGALPQMAGMFQELAFLMAKHKSVII